MRSSPDGHLRLETTHLRNFSPELFPREQRRCYPREKMRHPGSSSPTQSARAVGGDAMYLRLAALFVFSFVVASLVLVLVVVELKQRQRESHQASPLLNAEDINHKTLEAAEAVKAKQAEGFLQHQH
jgi:hypothetical protein